MTFAGTVHIAVKQGDELVAPDEGGARVATKADRRELGMAVLIPYVAVLIAVIIIVVVVVVSS